MRKHFVEFFSPGTFVPESTHKPIDTWDTKQAVSISKTITERYNARPYAFSFVTMLVADPVSDGEGGTLEVKSKEVERSGLHFLGGEVLTYDQVKARNLDDEKILRDNMLMNKKWLIIQNRNSFLFTEFFDEDSCIVNDDGKIVRSAQDADLVRYRKVTDAFAAATQKENK